MNFQFAELRKLVIVSTLENYRVKSVQSAIMKYNRYYSDHQARKVFNDLLGFRSLCDNYQDVLELCQKENPMMMDIEEFMYIIN